MINETVIRTFSSTQVLARDLRMLFPDLGRLEIGARLTSAHRLSSDGGMSAEEIERLIPHRPPMRLIDEIVSRTDNEIVCRKTFHADEFFVQGHFPDYPIVPGVIQCECCLQAGAILLSQQTPGDASVVPVATRLDSVKFKRMVRPGDTVEIQATLKDSVSTAYYLTGKMLLDGKITARLDFTCSITNPGEATEAQGSPASAPSSGASS